MSGKRGSAFGRLFPEKLLSLRPTSNRQLKIQNELDRKAGLDAGSPVCTSQPSSSPQSPFSQGACNSPDETLRPYYDESPAPLSPTLIKQEPADITDPLAINGHPQHQPSPPTYDQLNDTLNVDYQFANTYNQETHDRIDTRRPITNPIVGPDQATNQVPDQNRPVIDDTADDPLNDIINDIPINYDRTVVKREPIDFIDFNDLAPGTSRNLTPTHDQPPIDTEGYIFNVRHTARRVFFDDTLPDRSVFLPETRQRHEFDIEISQAGLTDTHRFLQRVQLTFEGPTGQFPILRVQDIIPQLFALINPIPALTCRPQTPDPIPQRPDFIPLLTNEHLHLDRLITREVRSRNNQRHADILIQPPFINRLFNMAEHCKYPPNFSGQASTDPKTPTINSREWTNKCHAFFRLRNVTDVTDARCHLLTFSTGPVNRYLEALQVDHFADVDELLDAIRRTFDVQQSHLTLKRDILSRKFTLTDDINTFISDMRELSQKAGIVDEASIVDSILLNLPPRVTCLLANLDLPDIAAVHRALSNIAPILKESVLQDSLSSVPQTNQRHLNAMQQNTPMNQPTFGSAIPGFQYAQPQQQIKPQIEYQNFANNQNYPANNQSYGIICQLCNKKGHTSPNCRTLPNYQSQNQNSRGFGSQKPQRPVICYYCNVQGHYAPNCEKKLIDIQTGVYRPTPGNRGPLNSPVVPGYAQRPQTRQNNQSGHLN
jgi:hypothetical protein